MINKFFVYYILTFVLFYRVADAGGVFLHVTQRFWDQIKDYIFEDYGNIKLFDTSGENFLIVSNPFVIYTQKLQFIGKLLFWCLLHNGAWPHWIDDFHFKFMFEMHIDYIQTIKHLQPSVYKIVEKILNYEGELKPSIIEGLYEWAIQYGFQVIIISYLFYYFKL